MFYGKAYDKDGFLRTDGLTVVFESDRVIIGACTYPLEDLEVDEAEITNGSWVVRYA